MYTNMKYFIYSLMVLVISCKTQDPAITTSTAEKEKMTSTGKEITVTGTAEHAKLGAMVLNENGSYYIKNKSDWDKEGYHKKKIRVTGILETVKGGNLKNENGEYSAGAEGDIHYIIMQKCELVE